MSENRKYESVGECLRGAVKIIHRNYGDKHPALADIQRALEKCAEDGKVEHGTLLYDGLEDAFIGLGSRCGFPDVAVYDGTKILEGYVAGGMDTEEASEFLEYNVLGGYIGPTTPIVLLPMSYEAFVETLEETDEEIANGVDL